MSTMTKRNSVDDFLNHRFTERGGAFTKGWREKGKVSRIKTWMHVLRVPMAIWIHNVPRIVTREDRRTGETKTMVLGGNYVCREDEAILSRQYHRTDADDRRKHPPERCPDCKLVEHVRDLVLDEKIHWLEPLFRFEGDEGPVVVTATGLFGGFPKTVEDFSRQEEKEFRDAGLKLRDVWSQNWYAKGKYVFCIVNHDNVGAGCTISTESNMLGDRVKEAIQARMKDLGAEAGNPFVVPCAFEWEHNPLEREIQKQYKAWPMSSLELTPEIRKLIVEDDPPDISQVTAPFNLASMRSVLEEHALVDLPWDEIFDVPRDEEGEQDPAGEFPPKPEDAAPKGRRGRARAHEVREEPPKEEPKQEEPEEACPICGPGECPHEACVCGAPMLPTDPVCKACGKIWIPDKAVPPPTPTSPEPRGRRARKARETGAKPGF